MALGGGAAAVPLLDVCVDGVGGLGEAGEGPKGAGGLAPAVHFAFIKLRFSRKEPLALNCSLKGTDEKIHLGDIRLCQEQRGCI